MSLQEKSSIFNREFDPPLLRPDFFDVAKCVICDILFRHQALIVNWLSDDDVPHILISCSACYDEVTRPDVLRARHGLAAIRRHITQLEQAGKAVR